MKREILIHKVIITAEARFDYEEVMELGKLPKADIKNLIEDYLSLKDGEYQDCDVKYFSVKYLDESVGKYLKLFLYKGERFKSMQMWRLVGICRDKDWNEELEDCGQIRNWLKQRVECLPKTRDWVLTYMENLKAPDLPPTQSLSVLKKHTRRYIKDEYETLMWEDYDDI